MRQNRTLRGRHGGILMTMPCDASDRSEDVRRLPSVVGVVSVLAGVAGVATLIYLWLELGHRGEIADATQSAGYTTTGEIVAGVLGLGLTWVGVFGIFVTVFLWLRSSDRRLG